MAGIKEIRTRIDRGERALVTTLTVKMAEDLTDYHLNAFRVFFEVFRKNTWVFGAAWTGCNDN